MDKADLSNFGTGQGENSLDRTEKCAAIAKKTVSAMMGEVMGIKSDASQDLAELEAKIAEFLVKNANLRRTG